MKTIPSIKILLANVCLLFCLCFLSKTNAHATHITGGELSYECLGSFTYKITLKLYRDCISGDAGFDDPAKITVWSGTGAYMQVLELPYQGATMLPFIAADTNWVPQGYECVEVATYTIATGLPQSLTGYTFAYQRCCRTGSIVNITDPLNIGATYWAVVPASELCNNGPVFNNHPPLALCVNRPMTFDHSAVDVDGDSLVYKLCTSYEGATPSDPMPYVTSPPPFSAVTYVSPFTANLPMFGSPVFAIDPNTGIVTVTPLSMGNFEVGICCDEYRNGVFIGTHYSDFRYSVAECPYGIGIENYESISCEVYPNPTTDFVQFKSDQEINIMVFDMVGKLVYLTINANQMQIISTVEWANGVYTYRAISGDGMSTGKLIKQ